MLYVYLWRGCMRWGPNTAQIHPRSRDLDLSFHRAHTIPHLQHTITERTQLWSHLRDRTSPDRPTTRQFQSQSTPEVQQSGGENDRSIGVPTRQDQVIVRYHDPTSSQRTKSSVTHPNSEHDRSRLTYNKPTDGFWGGRPRRSSRNTVQYTQSDSPSLPTKVCTCYPFILLSVWSSCWQLVNNRSLCQSRLRHFTDLHH